MKISLALGPRKPLDREQARACLIANLCFPGSGSLLAGRRIGYAQAAIYTAGFLLSMMFAVGIVSLWVRTREFPLPDESWDAVRRATFWRILFVGLVGVALFVVSWLWALLTSLILASEVKRDTTKQPEPQAGKAKPPTLKAP